MPIIDHAVSDVSQLISEALELQLADESSFLWFRGVAAEPLDLIPRIMRDGNSADDVFEREARLLTRFRQRSMPYWPAGYPQSDWEHLFAMQHYGMPTRLLDWSESLLVAAYFAFLDPPAGHENAKPAVWCIDPVAWNRATPVLSEFGASIQVLTTADEEAKPYQPQTDRRRQKSPIAIYGAHNSNRIVAQRGTFMVWGNQTESLQEISTSVMCDVHKFVISADRETLRAALRKIGVGETMVFPELSSLAEELSRSEGWRK